MQSALQSRKRLNSALLLYRLKGIGPAQASANAIRVCLSMNYTHTNSDTCPSTRQINKKGTLLKRAYIHVVFAWHRDLALQCV